jgi:hypothetical protein
MSREISISTAPFAAGIASFTVGFVKLHVHGLVEDAVGAGSGTLVSIGNVRGILTAAHVLEHLPSKGAVGIVEFLGETVHHRKRVIEMADTKKVIIGGEACAPHGPDLGFLRLPHESIGWLTGTNSFYDLKKRRNDAQERKPPAPHFMHAVAGLVQERTKDLPAQRPGERRKRFEAVFSDGDLVASDLKNGFDLVEFAPKKNPDTNPPNSYQGTSGGALWRIFFDIEQDQPRVAGCRLWGVPFYQSPPSDDGSRTLTCHAMSGVYGALMEEIVKTWPEESAG